MATIHLWGVDGAPALISPESIALFWLVNTCEVECTVVFSNNAHLSPREELPLYVGEDGSAAYEYPEIVEQLLGRELGLEERSLVCWAAERCGALSDYQLYLNRKNYEQYTRRVFSQLLPWPLWYNTPVQRRERARAQRGGTPAPAHDAEKELAQHSKTLQATRELRERGEKALADAAAEMEYAAALDRALQPWIAVRGAAATLGPAELLFAAHLYVQQQLPDGARVTAHLRAHYPALCDGLLRACELHACAPRAAAVAVRAPTAAETPSVPRELYRYVTSYWTI
ncbi:ADR136Cp [Eremothecium gossypii ATCC 10895]|uniref:ADR136Cp n=1 Tax=Eremothecium gossypii (strain ATCC 10895 / CBS 109.51 / FGSC 9923 / NRRL Y-1056) TaxID=284811 RepID=Q759Y7_EREGS|nr:ADR136Cp [Eremothecium gossypii ATCC 10895]AAS52056.1 ADR136Cp [Eremothecium gossypii ATCC 10895]AEY96355.1 FADR136Cp [Eremothecium gossypii FDAG1]